LSEEGAPDDHFMKLKLQNLFIIVILAGWFNPDCFATALKTDSIDKDTTKTYFVSYQDKHGLYGYGINKYNTFSFVDLETNRELQYSPNGQFNLGLGFTYKWLGLGVAFSPGFINNDDDEFAKRGGWIFRQIYLPEK
jgi:hypothetical protein